MANIQLNGTKLDYIERGQGEPVVLVHCTLGDYRSWEQQMDTFAETYRTISYSRRYHYPNQCSGDESDYSAALHADDLAAFMAGLGLESAHIVGNSYGAYTALLNNLECLIISYFYKLKSKMPPSGKSLQLSIKKYFKINTRF